MYFFPYLPAVSITNTVSKADEHIDMMTNSNFSMHFNVKYKLVQLSIGSKSVSQPGAQGPEGVLEDLRFLGIILDLKIRQNWETT